MSDRHPLYPLSEAERVKRLADMGLGPDLVPLNATAAERQAAMEPTTSPTGTPIIPATSVVWKIAVAVVGLAGVFLASDFFPSSSWDERIAGAIVSLGAMVGIASPGVRKG